MSIDSGRPDPMAQKAAAQFGAISDYAEQAWGVKPQTVEEVEFFAHMVCQVKDENISALPYGHTVEGAKKAAGEILTKEELAKPPEEIPPGIVKHLTEQSSPSLKKAAAAVESAKTKLEAATSDKEKTKIQKDMSKKVGGEIREDFVKNIVKDVKPPPIIVADIVAVVDASKNLPRYLQVKTELRKLESDLETLKGRQIGVPLRPDHLEAQASTERIKYLESEIASRKKEIGLLKQEGAAGVLGTIGLFSGSTAQLGGAGVSMAQAYTKFVAPHLPGTAHVSSNVMAHATAVLGTIVAGGAIGVGVVGSAVVANSMIDTSMKADRLEDELNKLEKQSGTKLSKKLTEFGQKLINLRKDNIESHQKSNIKKDVWKHRLAMAMYVTCIVVGALLLAGVACTPYGILAVGLTAAIVGGIMWKRKRNKYLNQGRMGEIVELQTDILKLQQDIKKITEKGKPFNVDELIELNDKLQAKQVKLKKVKVSFKLECEASPDKQELVQQFFDQIDAALPGGTKIDDPKVELLKKEISKLENQIERIVNDGSFSKDELDKIAAELQEKREALEASKPLNHVELIGELESITGLDLSAFAKDEFSEKDKTELKDILVNWITNTDTNLPGPHISKGDYIRKKLGIKISEKPKEAIA